VFKGYINIREPYYIMHYGGKDMKKIIVVGIILLFLGSSVPALAKTHSSLPKTTISSISTSSEDYEVYIGAGINRMYGEGKFGWGWHMFVENTGDTNITGAWYENTTTLSGEVIGNGYTPFSIPPGVGEGPGSVTLLDFHPITLINLTVVVENMTYSKSGYEIGPFVILIG
jgi:hypothetical protein